MMTDGEIEVFREQIVPHDFEEAESVDGVCDQAKLANAMQAENERLRELAGWARENGCRGWCDSLEIRPDAECTCRLVELLEGLDALAKPTGGTEL